MLRRINLLELAVLGALLVQYGAALRWLAQTWSDATYESWGVLPLLLLLPRILRPPPRRPQPSRPHLLGLLALALLEVAASRLRLNIASALLAVISLHLWSVAFRLHQGRWYGQPQLWLALLTLPAVFWGNLLFGYSLQQLATRMAAAGLRLYGLSVSVHGTMLELPTAVITVDASCSGVKLLYGGVLFGIVAGSGALRRLLFWTALLAGLLAANAARVMCLALAQLQLGHPLGDAAHQAVGMVCFVLVAASSLLLLRGGARLPAPRCCA